MAHQAQVIEIKDMADGVIAVLVRCCGDPSTDSYLTLHELHRDDAEIDKDIADHVAKVEKIHHARNRAKQHIARLVK